MPDSSLCKYLDLSGNPNPSLLVGRETSTCGIQIPSSKNLCHIINNTVYTVNVKQTPKSTNINKPKNVVAANKSKNPVLTKHLRSSVARNNAAKNSSTEQTSTAPTPDPAPAPADPAPTPTPEPAPATTSTQDNNTQDKRIREAFARAFYKEHFSHYAA